MKKKIYKIIAIITGVAAVACAAVGGYKYYQEKHAGEGDGKERDGTCTGRREGTC